MEMDHALEINKYSIRIITHNRNKSCTISLLYINYKSNNIKFISYKKINYLIQCEINRARDTKIAIWFWYHTILLYYSCLKILLKLLDRSRARPYAFRNVFCDVPLSSRPQQICFVNSNFGGCNDDAASFLARAKL